MEKQFVDLVALVFTLDWVILGLPLSLVLSTLTTRVMPGFILAAVAVVIHHLFIIVISVFATGGDASGISPAIQAQIPKLVPLSVAAEYVAYAFLIIVFSLTRQDMFRPGVGEQH